MAEEAADGKKGGLLKYIMYGLGGIALIGLGLGAGYFVFGSKAADPSEEIEEIIERKMREAEEAAAAEAAANKGPERKEAPEVKNFLTTYYEFSGTFTTNLRESKKFIQAGIGVSTQYDDAVLGNVEAHQLALRSEILGTMSNFSEEAIQGKSGRDDLANAIKDSLNKKLEELEGFGGVEYVHFTSFMLQ
ncbi:MAG: flagellar basal body-associated FliL family protein [Pseudomonadota bacterium]|nr:flagellar basal body-associated FliL family protein [Pseudomonadota bacterium]